MEIINFSIIQSLFWIFIISLKLEYSEFDTKKKKRLEGASDIKREVS